MTQDTTKDAVPYRELSVIYVAVHNAACEEFQRVFKDAGARMWTADNAHPLRESNRQAVEASMRSVDRAGDSNLCLWLNPIQRPLTVLDSYPEVKNNPAQVEKLRAGVDEICERYRRVYLLALEALLGKRAVRGLEREISRRSAKYWRRNCSANRRSRPT